jgi:hypothetical protein
VHGASFGETKRVVTEHFTIDHEGISEDTLKIVVRDAEQAFRDVTGLLGKDFGERKISIRISEDFPFPRSTAVDATIKFPPSRLSPTGALTGPSSVRGRAMGFWHSVTKVVAPSGQARDEWGRFLEDGLGGCLQSKFGGKRATPWPAKFYPTMGQDSHWATAALASKIGLFSLTDAVRHAKSRRLTRTRRLGWLQAASFVCHLIDTRTLDRFKVWYDGGSFEKAYGVDMGTVERDWAKFIRDLKS